MINAVVSFLQERRAAGVVETLRKRLQVSARVLRDSAWQLIPARELVPGDVVRVRPGDIVPADVKVVTGTLSVDQSALTGESQDVEKASGLRARRRVPSFAAARENGVVAQTGAKTSFGHTTELVQQARPKLHIEAVVTKVVRWLFVIVGALLAVVVVLSLIRGVPMGEMVPLVLVLLDERRSRRAARDVHDQHGDGLEAARPARRAGHAPERGRRRRHDGRALRGQDRHHHDEPAGGHGSDSAGALDGGGRADGGRDGVAGSQPGSASTSPFSRRRNERHLLAGAAKFTPVSFEPFDAKNRRTEAVVEQAGARVRAMKGAVRTIAEACGLATPAIEALEVQVSAAAAKGYRTLAVARGPETGPMSLVGLVSLFDPPRPDAKELIAALRGLGVSVKMLTGDALPVASELARGVGLPNIRSMQELKAAVARPDSATSDLLAGVDGYAEVFPEDKYVVVQRLQKAGHVTGMTGDGVNDAPALRQAEVGIAVSSATDVAKGAASVVLTAPGLTNIVALVEQGRAIYQRILTWIVNKISRTILKAAFVSVAFVLTGKFVVSVFAMLLLTFMTDFAKISLATDHVRPSQKPETWQIGGFIAVSVVLGVAMVAEALAGLWLCWSRFGLATSDDALHTFSFLLLLYFAVFSVVSARERRAFWSTVPGRALLTALATETLAGTAVIYLGIPGLPPLPLAQTLAILAYAMISCLVVNDALKVALIRWRVPTAVA